jgi:hypothetical protein
MSPLSARLAAVAIALAVSGAAAPLAQRIKMGPVETGPATLTAARKYLEGRWALLSYEIFRPGESSLRLEGEGTLVYDDFGNLQMDVRVNEQTALVLEGVGIRTTDGLLSTQGRTVIDLPARTLVFVLDGQPAFGAPSGPLALNRPRHWEIDGNELTLTTRDDEGRPLAVSRWRKEER